MGETLPTGLYVDGRWRHETTAGELPHVNPATGQVQRHFPVAGAHEIDLAVAAARAALPAWRASPGPARRDLLRSIAAAIRAAADDFGLISALEAGALRQPFMARGSAEWWEYYAGWADKLGEAAGGYVEPALMPGIDVVVPEPVGVVGAILTWNAPVSFLGMCLPAALAAGCCVIVKAPEKAPFTSIRFAQLCEEVGVPRGVVQVLPGAGEAGQALAAHEGVDKVTFTGGPVTARHVLGACAARVTPAVMELGGKSANIVFADADIPRAIGSAVRFVFNTGQGCSLPTRLVVQDEVYDSIVGGVVRALAQVKVGDPLDPSTQMGPVIDAAACERILTMVERAVARGDAKLLCGGERLGGELASGYFIAPTVLGDVDPASEIAQEEVFGPVLCATRFRDEQEAVDIANGTRFGLAAYVQTESISRAHRLIRALDAGSVHVNGSGPGPVGAAMPFGGVRQSGFGRQGGRAGLLEFLQLKNVLINTGQGEGSG